MRKLGVIVVLLGGIIVILLALGIRRMGYRDSERICENLNAAGLFEASDDCTIARDPKVFLPAMFPTYRTNIEIVKQGMEGFKIIKETNQSRCNDGAELTVVFYELSPAYQVDFPFCDGILVNIRYSD